MREKKPFVIQFIVGVILIGIGMLTQFDYYSTLLFAMGCGISFGAAVQIMRILYWQSPKRQTEYAGKKQEAHINCVDERKQYLRMKSGHVTYQIMTFSMLALAFILTLFRVEAWISAMIFLLFILQWGIGIVVYRILERRI